MTAPKPPTTRPTKKLGFLVCDSCKRSIPYQSYEGSKEPMPQHRCVGANLEVVPFDRYSKTDPFRPALPKPVF